MANFIEQFKKEIEGFVPSSARGGGGVVTRVQDGVAEIEGLESTGMAEMVRFIIAAGKTLEKAVEGKTEVFGVILNLEEESARAIILGDTGLVAEGMPVLPTGKTLSIPVGEALLGRVVSALGEPLDGLGAIKAAKHNPIER